MKVRLEKAAARRFPPAAPAPEAGEAAPEAPVVGPGATEPGDLDARIEAIARRVAREVVEEGATRRDR
jgi:hypothetical protein